jgi:hypothetical protein
VVRNPQVGHRAYNSAERGAKHHPLTRLMSLPAPMPIGSLGVPSSRRYMTIRMLNDMLINNRAERHRFPGYLVIDAANVDARAGERRVQLNRIPTMCP